MTAPSAPRVTLTDIVYASCVSLAVQLAAYAVFSQTYRRGADSPRIDPGYGVPVNIMPMLDVLAPGALPKLGVPKRFVLPASWQRRRPPPPPKPMQKPPSPVPNQPQVTSPGGDPRDAAPRVVSDAGLLDATDATALADSDATVDADAALGAEEGLPEGVPEGTITEAWKVRAIDMYRARLINFVRSYFQVTGSGLPQERLRELKVRAVLTVSATRRIEGYTMTPSGEPAFDRAAKNALEAVKGLELPPPPPDYPGAVQQTIPILFQCTGGQCS